MVSEALMRSTKVWSPPSDFTLRVVRGEEEEVEGTVEGMGGSGVLSL